MLAQSVLTASADSNSLLGNKCETDLQCSPPYLVCRNAKCSRKPLFAMTDMEIGSLFIMLALVMFAVVCSLSGGLVVVPISILMMQFTAKQAVTLANCIVLLTSFTKYVMGLFKRNPKVDFKTIVDYNSAIIMAPTITLFSTIGGILTFFLPDVLILFILIIMLIFSMVSAVRQIIKLQKERKSQKSQILPVDTERRDLTKDRESHARANTEAAQIKPANDKLKPEDTVKIAPELKPINLENSESLATSAMLKGNPSAGEEQIAKEISHQKKIEGSNFYLPKFLLIVTVLVVSVLTGIFRGGKGLDSVIGVKKCSGADWGLLAAYCVILGALPCYSYFVVFKEQKLKQKINWNLDPAEVTFTKSTFFVKVTWSAFTGLVSTITGLGGGVILTPMMAWMNYMPVTASWTINLLVLLSKIAAFIVAILSGQLLYDYVFFFGCLIALTIIGAENTVLILVKKMNSQIILPIILFSIMFFALILDLYLGINQWVEKDKAGKSAWEFASYC